MPPTQKDVHAFGKPFANVSCHGLYVHAADWTEIIDRNSRSSRTNCGHSENVFCCGAAVVDPLTRPLSRVAMQMINNSVAEHKHDHSKCQNILQNILRKKWPSGNPGFQQRHKRYNSHCGICGVELVSRTILSGNARPIYFCPEITFIIRGKGSYIKKGEKVIAYVFQLSQIWSCATARSPI
jgi:hypothetical protein